MESVLGLHLAVNRKSKSRVHYSYQQQQMFCWSLLSYFRSMPHWFQIAIESTFYFYRSLHCVELHSTYLMFQTLVKRLSSCYI